MYYIIQIYLQVTSLFCTFARLSTKEIAHKYKNASQSLLTSDSTYLNIKQLNNTADFNKEMDNYSYHNFSPELKAPVSRSEQKSTAKQFAEESDILKSYKSQNIILYLSPTKESESKNCGKTFNNPCR